MKSPCIYSTEYLAANLKIHKKSNFDRNQLKNFIQHKNMYMHQEKILKWGFLS